MPSKSIISKRSFVLSFLGLFLNFFAQAQLEIQFPTERAVFQRDLNNEGTIYISGSVKERVDKIEARLKEHKDGGLLDFKDWEEIENNSKMGSFKGALKVRGGWYQLEIRAIKGSDEVYKSVLNKVGVGEVFVISGQSNAQGIAGFGATGAKDDRVNCANFLNENFSSTPNTSLVFSQLNDNANIGPIGFSPWCWGQVGDSLARQFGVPIMFFNTALTRTLSSNWYQSSIGVPTRDAIFQGLFQPGFPYQYLKTTMQYYASLFGIRAVLWHQGETDTHPGVPVEEEIFGYYKGVIENIRKDFGHNMAWMFSRVSYSDGRTSQVVLNAHDRIINKAGFNIFEGPSTDNLMIPRYDEVHFGNTPEVKGLELLAGAWIEKLDSGFFAACQPILTNPLVDLEVACFQNNQAKVTVPQNYSIYKWSDGGGGNERFVSSGKVSADLTNALGNYKIGTAVNIDAVIFQQPTVFSKRMFICDTDTLVLSSDARFTDITWSNDSVAAAIQITDGGTFTYRAKNGVGCDYESESLTIDDIPLPGFAQKFGLTVNGVLTTVDTTVGFCEGTSILLRPQVGFDSYFWSDGLSLANRTIDRSGEFSYYGIYSPGCMSRKSPSLFAVEHENPPQPIIYSDALFELDVLNASEFDGFKWMKNETFLPQNTSKIKVSESGLYSLSAFKSYGEGVNCTSVQSLTFQKDLVNFEMNVAYPNPSDDFIYLESPEIQRNVKVKLYNSLGRQVKEIPLVKSWETKLTIPVKGLPAGVYLLVLESDDSLLRKKIIIL